MLWNKKFARIQTVQIGPIFLRWLFQTYPIVSHSYLYYYYVIVTITRLLGEKYNKNQQKFDYEVNYLFIDIFNFLIHSHKFINFSKRTLSHSWHLLFILFSVHTKKSVGYSEKYENQSQSWWTFLHLWKMCLFFVFVSYKNFPIFVSPVNALRIKTDVQKRRKLFKSE